MLTAVPFLISSFLCFCFSLRLISCCQSLSYTVHVARFVEAVDGQRNNAHEEYESREEIRRDIDSLLDIPIVG